MKIKGFIVFLLLQLLWCMPVLAQDPAQAVLHVEPKGETVKLTLTVQNAVFQGVQASVYYNPAEIPATQADYTQTLQTGEEWNGQNLFSVAQSALDAEKGVISFTVISNLGQTVPNEKMGDKYQIVADQTGIRIFSVELPCAAEKPEVGFAVRESKVYDPGNPNGLQVSFNGQNVHTKTLVLYSDGSVGQTSEIKATVPPKPVAEQRAERLKNTLILQNRNYAATVSGALQWIDSQNKQVMPNESGVPLRFVAEAFGFKVAWDNATQTVILAKEDITEVFVVGEYGSVLQNDRTLVPAENLAKLLQIRYTPVGDCIIFTEQDRPWNTEGAVENGILADAIMIMSPMIRDLQ